MSPEKVRLFPSGISLCGRLRLGAHIVAAHMCGICTWGTAFFFVIGFGILCEPSFAALKNPWFVAGMVSAVVLAVPLGWLVGAMLGGVTQIGRLARIFNNGWRFRAGDKVIVLAGSYRGTVTVVYEIWNERGQVRLDLGEAAKVAVTDVVASNEVLAFSIYEKSLPSRSCDSVIFRVFRG